MMESRDRVLAHYGLRCFMETNAYGAGIDAGENHQYPWFACYYIIIEVSLQDACSPS